MDITSLISNVFTQELWMAMAFLLLIVMLVKPIKKLLLPYLSNHSHKIENDLIKALQAKCHAYELMQKLNEEHKQTLIDAQNMIEKAKEEASFIMEEGYKKIEKLNQKNESIINEYIHCEEKLLFKKFKSEILISLMTIVNDELLDFNEDESYNILEIRKKALKKIWN